MKKIKYLVFFLVLAFASCEDATNIIQDGEVGDVETFTSTGQMRAFLLEAYDRIDAGTNASNGVAVSSILTDEVGIGRGGSATGDFYRFVVNLSNGYSSQIWLDNYTVINYCNRLIRGAALVTPVDAADQLAYNDIIAQARALRAYSHLQLLTYFSMDMKDDNGLGVILMDRVPTLLEQLPRSTNGQVFALINSDLDYAYANIQPSLTPTTKSWTYVTKGMISAVRARMYAYRGQYALAEQYATTAIADSGLSITDGTVYTNSTAFYAAAGSNNQYKRMFQDLAQGEMIWSVGRSVGKTSIASIYAVNLTTTAGVTLYDMNRNLFNLLDNGATSGVNANGTNPAVDMTRVRDIRRFVDIDPTLIVTNGVNGYLTATNYQFSDNLPIDKYSGIAGASLINDIKVFRVSEMVLIQAEGRAAAGDLPGVATLLKSIRDKRTIAGQPLQPLPVYANPTAAWADILLERRLELAFEGHRYIDVKRLGALAGGVTFDRHPLDCSTFSLPECSIPLGDYRFTLPIPLNEVSGNSAIKQNTGYEN